MPRYIEEETFVKFVEEHFCNGCNNYNGVKCKSCSVDDAIGFVESAPTADVVEIETLRKWLYEIAINNVGCVLDGDFSTACEEIISRLDGLRKFAQEKGE